MNSTFLLLLAFMLGCVCGLRSMTGPALVCWGARLGWLHLAASPLRWMGSPISVAVFTLFALGELVADKLPIIPSRITPGPLAVRIVFGGLCGAALGISASSALVMGAIGGMAGSLVGSFGGYHLRRFLTLEKKLPDLPVALVEDACAVGVGLFAVTRF